MAWRVETGINCICDRCKTERAFSGKNENFAHYAAREAGWWLALDLEVEQGRRGECHCPDCTGYRQ